MVASLLVANPDDGSYAAAILLDQQKYAPDHITDAILFIDMEVIRIGQDTPGWGFRSQYCAVTAVATSGNSLPAHPGKVGFVEIQKTVTTSYVRGIRAQSIDAITRLIENPDSRYGTGVINGGRYYIDEEDRFYFTGYRARVEVPLDLPITATCQAPAAYEPTIARGAVMMLAKDPLDPSLFSFYGQQYQADLARIRGLEMGVPPLDSLMKAGG
jgi:hypothetical protein